MKLIFILLFVILAYILYQKYYHRVRKPWSSNIEQDTIDNTNWRKVVSTTDNLQVVLMSVPPGEELGRETHPSNDQFFRVERGEGELILDDKTIQLHDGVAAVVPAGLAHNVVNLSGTDKLQFYTIYGPPHHPHGTIDETHEDEIKRES